MIRFRLPGTPLRAVLSCGVVAGLAACDGVEVTRYQSAVQTSQVQTAVSASAATVAPLCTPTGAHAAHQGWVFQCTTCHPCGGVIEISSQTLADGFAVSGTVTRSTDPSGNPISGSATCTVTCHGNQPVSWNSSGLGCSSCHGQWNGSGGMVSTHGIDPATGLDGNAAVCVNCHTSANHFDPSMGLVNANDGTSVLVSAATVAQVTTFCQSCHDGSGKTFGGSGPPIGNFENHRTHLGAGFGGAIKPPFQPGQGPIDCIVCHTPHGSSNPYMFAATVNGNPIAPGSINRAGAGAEALCMSCHLGDKHSGCKQSSCHDGVSIIRGQVMNNEPVPSNGPCFYCHDHAGIIRFAMPTWDNHPTGAGTDYCGHCHSSWYPRTTGTTPPAVTSIVAGNLTTTTADITWTTGVAADSWVEYGTADVNNVTGSRTLVTSHKVTLTGLTAGTTYRFRVRTSDGLHNLAEAPAQPATFTTPTSSGGGSTEPAPSGLVAYNDPLFPNDVADVSSPIAVTFQWGSVTSPSGSTRYNLQVSTSSAFTTLVASAANLTATSVVQSIPVSAWWPSLATYYWRVQAVDAASSTTSAWANGQFTAYLYSY